MRVTFYGVRGSYAASGTRFASVGAHTTCVRIDAASHVVVVDAGTGIAALGRDLLASRPRAAPLKVVLLLTHGHHDHLAGLPHFLPMYDANTTVFAYGPPAMGTAEALARMFRPPWFPVRLDELRSHQVARDLRENEAIFLRRRSDPTVYDTEHADSQRTLPRGKQAPEVVIRALRCLSHPRDGVYVYRIEHGGRSVVVATDVEGFSGTDVRLVRFAEGADLLIHDAHLTEERYLSVPAQGFGHATYRMACEVASKAGVGRLILTHHAPDSDDEEVARIEAAARALFPDTLAGREGLSVEID